MNNYNDKITVIITIYIYKNKHRSHHNGPFWLDPLVFYMRRTFYITDNHKSAKMMHLKTNNFQICPCTFINSPINLKSSS